MADAAALGKLDPRSGTDTSGSNRQVFAALDLGTNNCRLLIARPVPGGFRVIDAFSRIVRLGEGVNRTGSLSEAAMARTIRALKVCAAKMRRCGVTRTRAVATEACRRAANCSAFLARVLEETDLELEIISSDEEVALAMRGCAPLLDAHASHALIFDIGGGSTDVGWMHAPEPGNGTDGGAPAIGGWHSVPIGVVALADRHGGRHVTPDLYAAMVAEMHAALAPFEAQHHLAALATGGRLQMLGTSGTVTTLAGVHQDLPRYDRARIDGCYLDFEIVHRLSRRIAAMSYEHRAAHPCIGPGRADLVIAGCAILEAICATWPVGRLRVADRGLREGILLEMMCRPNGSSDPAAPTGARSPSP